MAEEYVVEAIRKWRYNYREKRREYFIKWKNYTDEENTWEPEYNLNCPIIYQEFLNSLNPRERERATFSKPEKLTGFQRNAEFLKCIGADGPHESDEEEGSTKKNKQPFYLLATFKDCDLAEEIEVKEFFENRPDDLFNFFEQRILIKPPKSNEGVTVKQPTSREKGFAKPRPNFAKKNMKPPANGNLINMSSSTKGLETQVTPPSNNSNMQAQSSTGDLKQQTKSSTSGEKMRVKIREKKRNITSNSLET